MNPTEPTAQQLAIAREIVGALARRIDGELFVPLDCTIALILAKHQEPASEREGEWQPMKTAPRNGDEVLLAVERRAGIPGKMLVGHYMPGGHCIEDHPPIDEGWYFWNGCSFGKSSKPLAWLPLPSFTPKGPTP